MDKRVVSCAFILLALIAVTKTGANADDKPVGDGSETCLACHEAGGNSVRNHEMWKSSGHSKSLAAIINNNQASPDCYSCHSDEGFKAKLEGKKVDVALKQSFHAVTCTTCHIFPHDSKFSGELVADPETLCSSCHTQRAVLQGKGARGIDDTRSFHSAVDCISCHMSETNHLMKVIRPDDPEVSDKRMDTCTTCHKDNNRKARIAQLQDWQSTYKDEMDPVQADLTAISAALKQNPNLLDDQMKQKLNDVRFNVSILTRDMSRGAHNVDFTAEILSNAAKDLRLIKSAAGIGQPQPKSTQ
jgi:predicted CXXCH cytochrome family protein